MTRVEYLLKTEKADYLVFEAMSAITRRSMSLESQ